MHALALVFAKHPQLELVVLQDKAVFEAAPIKRKRFIEAISYDKYHQLLHECDIALLPLAAHEGNACKSDLKFIECAAHEVVCIASPTVYAQSIQDGVTGLIAQSDEAFAQALEAIARASGPPPKCEAGGVMIDGRCWGGLTPGVLCRGPNGTTIPCPR